MKLTLSNNNVPSQLPTLDLLCEVVSGDGCFGHIPALPGLCFRGEDIFELESKAPEEIKKYVEWLIAEGISDLNPTISELAACVNESSLKSITIINKESLEGSPVWISGNPAVLFDYDLHPLDDVTVLAHLRFTRQVLMRLAEIAEVLLKLKSKQMPDPEHRSIDEMLTHIGNCVWWYCSRIDEKLPEPDEPTGETQADRMKRLYVKAEKYLISIPLTQRSVVHVPTRYRTNDPLEQWTHTKACRRQAEHAWEHLLELMQIAFQE